MLGFPKYNGFKFVLSGVCLVVALVLLFSSCISRRYPSNQVTCIGSKYYVVGSVDLGGKDLALKKGSVIVFQGGVISNGRIIGNSTRITGQPHLKNTHLAGSFSTTKFRSSWCMDDCKTDFIQDIMNLGDDKVVIVDSDILLSDKQVSVRHLSLEGDGRHAIINSDRFYITHGNVSICDVKFSWTLPQVLDPSDNYSSVVVYHELLGNPKKVSVTLKNIVADGGRYCSFFIRQHNSSVENKLRSHLIVDNCQFQNFTRGAIAMAGGSGSIKKSRFLNIGYQTTTNLRSVSAISLGIGSTPESRVSNYIIANCEIRNVAAAYNNKNDGRELHGIVCKGDGITIRNNKLLRISTRFSDTQDPGQDSEMIYIKGSSCLVKNNVIVDGVGTDANAVITFKSKGISNNKVMNNKVTLTAYNGCFVYLRGFGHLVKDNSFICQKLIGNDKSSCIYLSHNDDESKESVVIANNYFQIPSQSGYRLVYANKFQNLEFVNNQIKGAFIIMKANGQGTTRKIINNTITNNTNGSFDSLYELKDCSSVKLK